MILITIVPSSRENEKLVCPKNCLLQWKAFPYKGVNQVSTQKTPLTYEPSLKSLERFMQV